MRRSLFFRAGGIVALLGLMFATSACAPDASGPADPNSGGGAAPTEIVEVVENDGESGDGGAADNNGRAFGATDDMVITAVELTLSSKNAKAEWAGKTLRVTMDGSAAAPTASIPCLGVEALLEDGEDVTLVFSDGELICADRPTAG